jgi:3-hydroxy-9,10-secoandrosta-1,3,5(10)-triene-9,17-dione monooxygenase
MAKVIPGLDELKARARALVPALRGRAAQAEELRRVPDESIADLHRAGLFRAFQPRSIGGGELPYRAMVELGAILARGCGSTAWVLTNLASHHWMLGMWPKPAQDEIWGADGPDVLIGSAFAFPAGRASKVKGGHRLKGRWPFSSGVDPCAWNFIGALAEENGKLEPRVFIVKAADYAIIDNWHAAGLAGTGSKDVEIKDAFVPDHRSLSPAQISGGATPGSAVNPGPLYRLPVFSLFPFILSAVALGLAQGAIEEFTQSMRGRAGTYAGKKLAELATLQLRLAEASALSDAAEKAMISACEEATLQTEAGKIPALEDRVRWRRDAAYGAGMCAKAVDLLFAGAGGNAIYKSNPLQRIWRDVHAANGHYLMSWDMAGTLYGRVALGLPPDMPVL